MSDEARERKDNQLAALLRDIKRQIRAETLEQVNQSLRVRNIENFIEWLAEELKKCEAGK